MAEKITPQLQYAFICDDIAIMQDSSKVIAVGLFEHIVVNQIPASHSKLWLMSRWTDGVGEFTAFNVIKDPNGNEIFKSEEVKMKLAAPEAGYNINGQIMGLPIQGAGVYWVETYLDGTLVNKFPLSVSLQTPPREPEEKLLH